MEPLASSQDLAERGISVPCDVDFDTILASASDAVRDAAGCAISEVTSTVVLVVGEYRCVDLPAGPVSDVASVQVDGVEVDGWVKVGDTVVMPCGWTRSLPVEVTVTYTHGLPVVPADIVDLVCGMAAIAMGDGEYGDGSRLASVRLGQFSESYVHPTGSDSPSPMALPDSQRLRLRARFGNSVALVAQR